jgi:rhodanese-related sulfurtransferase
VPIEIDRAGVQRLLAEGAHLVEVLPATEYEDEHLPGAVNIPLKKLDRNAVARIPRDSPVIVYCWDAR